MDLTVNEKGQREVRGHHAVREAAKDWRTYSSDLTGDRDVRSAAASHEVPGGGAATIHERGAGAEGGLVRSARRPADLVNHRARRRRHLDRACPSIRDRLPDQRLQPSTGLPGRA